MATPVTSDRVALTNSPWAFSIEATRAALGLERLRGDQRLHRPGAGDPAAAGRRARADRRRRAGAGPGDRGDRARAPGSASAACCRSAGAGSRSRARAGTSRSRRRTRSRRAILAVLRQRFGHVSNERVLSGPGLVNLATALAALEGVDARRSPIRCRSPSAPAAASAASAARRSSASRRMLGAAAGDLALTLGARGGIYIGGGLVQAAGRAVRPRRAFARPSSPRGGSPTSSSRSRPIWSRAAIRACSARRRWRWCPERRDGLAGQPVLGLFGRALPASGRRGRLPGAAAPPRPRRQPGAAVLLAGEPRRRARPCDAAQPRQAAVASWQAEVVRPLRALRRRLKARLADPEPGSVVELWPGLAAAIRERGAGARDRRRASRPAGARAGRSRGCRPSAPPGAALAGANLQPLLAVRRPRPPCAADPAGAAPFPTAAAGRARGEPRLARALSARRGAAAAASL